MDMRGFDLSPYRRATVGFDRLFDFLENSSRAEQDNYPPFDIEKLSDDQYRITLAVAGFKREDIDITALQNMLVITGRRSNENRNKDGNFLHVGIATRAFERRFELADFVRVTSAELADGLLVVELVREVPEAMKPRKIEIGGGASRPAPTTIENQTDTPNAPEREAQAA
jgi:molecular chaperone IbpA